MSASDSPNNHLTVALNSLSTASRIVFHTLASYCNLIVNLSIVKNVKHWMVSKLLPQCEQSLFPFPM